MNCYRTFLLLLILLFIPSISIFAQKDRTLSNGFSLNFFVGIVPDNYGDYKDFYDEGREITPLLGAQIGHRWYVPINSKTSVGAMINWVEIAFAKVKTPTYGDHKMEESMFDIVFLETGPVISHAFDATTALDVYYNLRPGIYGDDRIHPSHCFGIASRKKSLNFGVEYVFGNIASGNYKGDQSVEMEINHFRLVFGFKF